MLDTQMQIVDSAVVDVSENAEQVSSAFDLGRRGIPSQACFVVHIEETSADTTIDPLSFVLQVSVDGGTTWHDVAAIHLTGNGAGSKPGPYSVPIGLLDLRQEVRNASAIKVRVAVRYPDGTATDDFTYSAYIGSGNPYPHFSNAGVYHS